MVTQFSLLLTLLVSLHSFRAHNSLLFLKTARFISYPYVRVYVLILWWTCGFLVLFLLEGLQINGFNSLERCNKWWPCRRSAGLRLKVVRVLCICPSVGTGGSERWLPFLARSFILSLLSVALSVFTDSFASSFINNLCGVHLGKLLYHIFLLLLQFLCSHVLIILDS